ncbi:MAG: transcriptional repressor LexA [Thermoanaerobaculia bacterium]
MALTLTPKQKEILDFIRTYRQKRGLSPTQREICEEFGYSSFGTLQKHIRLLLEKGVLVRDWNKRRSLVLAEEEKPAGAVEIPLAGRIAAGQPIEPEPEGETVAVPDVLTRKGQNYVLRVNGSSMIDDGIHDGDFVVVNKREKASNGEMVAALLNGEATLKRFYREADGRIRLQPANERMSPIWVAEGDLKVQGVVVGLMRKY